jgi:MFS family permease
MTLLDTFQQAWQSQRCAAPAMNPDALLKRVRLQRRLNLWVDIGVIVVFAGCGAWMLGSAFRDIHRGWPWLFYVASTAWVIGYILFNRWRRRRVAARADEPLLAHVEWSLKELEYQMWLDSNSLWWYVLPIALGCMIPPIVLFSMNFNEHHGWRDILGLLSSLAVFAVTFIFVHLVMKIGTRIANEKRRRELAALAALRESLLNTEEPPV